MFVVVLHPKTTSTRNCSESGTLLTRWLFAGSSVENQVLWERMSPPYFQEGFAHVERATGVLGLPWFHISPQKGLEKLRLLAEWGSV